MTISPSEPEIIQGPKKVGLIGVGRMGQGVGQCLLTAGFSLIVRDLNRNAAEHLILAGAGWAESPAELAQSCQIILISVVNTEGVEEILFGAQGVVAGALPGSVVVDLSTIAPLATQQFARRLADSGIEMLDAPVSGGSEGARLGTLSMMVGGKPEILEQVRPVLASFTSKITHVGEHGAGQAAKMVNQVVLVGTVLAMSEGLLLAEKHGLDLERTLKAIQGGAAGSWMLTNLGPKVIAHDWSPSFTIDLQLKDLRIVLDTADASGVPLLGTSLAYQLYRSLAARGHGQDGNHSLIQALYALIQEDGV